MASKHFENPGRRKWWSQHIVAWRRSGQSQRPLLPESSPDGDDVHALAEVSRQLGRRPETCGTSTGTAPGRAPSTACEGSREAAETEQCGEHGHGLACGPGVLGNARRGDELERHVTVSSVARQHGIVTSMLFRWRVELGFGRGKSVKLASVSIADGQTAAVVLHDLLLPPEGMAANCDVLFPLSATA